jgi:hypothetical protein
MTRINVRPYEAGLGSGVTSEVKASFVLLCCSLQVDEILPIDSRSILLDIFCSGKLVCRTDANICNYENQIESYSTRQIEVGNSKKNSKIFESYSTLF